MVVGHILQTGRPQLGHILSNSIMSGSWKVPIIPKYFWSEKKGELSRPCKSVLMSKSFELTRAIELLFSILLIVIIKLLPFWRTCHTKCWPKSPLSAQDTRSSFYQRSPLFEEFVWQVIKRYEIVTSVLLQHTYESLIQSL